MTFDEGKEEDKDQVKKIGEKEQGCLTLDIPVVEQTECPIMIIFYPLNAAYLTIQNNGSEVASGARRTGDD